MLYRGSEGSIPPPAVVTRWRVTPRNPRLAALRSGDWGVFLNSGLRRTASDSTCTPTKSGIADSMVLVPKENSTVEVEVPLVRASRTSTSTSNFLWH